MVFPGALKTSNPNAGLGYYTGAGSSVTQITTKGTTVICNGMCGAITTRTDSTAAAAEELFTVTNSSVEIGDVIVLSVRSGATQEGGIVPYVAAVAAGSFKIGYTNVNASADTGAVIINFAVIKAVSA
jgi:hypothetical protein